MVQYSRSMKQNKEKCNSTKIQFILWTHVKFDIPFRIPCGKLVHNTKILGHGIFQILQQYEFTMSATMHLCDLFRKIGDLIDSYLFCK